MAYRRTYRGLGMPAGYYIAGACDPATGAPASGGPNAYASVVDPSGGITCYAPNDPTYLKLLANANLTGPVGAAAQAAAAAAGISPTGAQIPGWTATVQNQPAAAPPVAASVPPQVPGGSAAAGSDILNQAMAWIQANPLYAAAAGVGILFLLKR